jgi:hypothetical protein
LNQTGPDLGIPNESHLQGFGINAVGKKPLDRMFKNIDYVEEEPKKTNCCLSENIGLIVKNNPYHVI